MSLVVMRMLVVPISQKDDGSDSDAQYDADSDIHSADLRLI